MIKPGERISVDSDSIEPLESTIVEEYLENADGDIPDYKYWYFDGKCNMICYICL